MRYQYQIKFYPWRDEYQADVVGLSTSLEREVKKRGARVDTIPFSGKRITLKTPNSLEADGTHLMKIDMDRQLFPASGSGIVRVDLVR